MKLFSSRLKPFCSVFLLVLICVNLAQANPESLKSKGSEDALAPLQTNGTIVLSPSFARYDAGELYKENNSPLTHLFSLRNDGRTNVTITRLKTSCGCTSAVVNGISDLPVSIPPGTTFQISVSVDMLSATVGPISKTVDVITASSETSAITLEIMGNVVPAISTMPSILDFGSVNVGKARKSLLTITVKQALIPKGGFPKLITDSPDIEINELHTQARDIPRPDGFHGTVSKTFLVSLLSRKHYGALSGFLHLSPPATSLFNNEITKITIPFFSKITGDITPSADMVDFGTVNQGASVIKQVSLSLSRADLSHLSIHAPNKIQYSLNKQQAVNLAGDRILVPMTLKLNTSSILGPISSGIRITVRHDSELVIPVSAYVISGK